MEIKKVKLSGCHICAGKLVKIRGKYPGDDKREVCPCCLQERLDSIQEISSKDYLKACNNAIRGQ